MTKSNSLTQNDIDNICLGNSEPWVFMSIHSKHVVIVDKVCLLFQLEKKIVNQNLILFSKASNLNHKEKSLQLFFGGLYLTSENPSISIFIGQLDMQAQLLKAYALTHQNTANLSEIQSHEYNNWHPESGAITIDLPVKAYLSQAGISCEDLTFNVRSWLNQNLGSTKIKHHLKLVG